MNKNQTIAVIDDDDIYVYAIRRTIYSTQYVNKIVSFPDGQEALDFFIQNLQAPEKLPDIVFLDINMPIVDGWQFLEEYRSFKEKIEKDIKIYITSSSKNPDDLIQAKNISEVSDYIVKPLTFEKFEELMER
jgi:CheY-like chemotaxis protein